MCEQDLVFVGTTNLNQTIHQNYYAFLSSYINNVLLQSIDKRSGYSLGYFRCILTSYHDRCITDAQKDFRTIIDQRILQKSILEILKQTKKIFLHVFRSIH